MPHILKAYVWFSNKFSLFQLKRMEEVTKKVALGEINYKNAKTSCQIVLFSSKCDRLENLQFLGHFNPQLHSLILFLNI